MLTSSKPVFPTPPRDPRSARSFYPRSRAATAGAGSRLRSFRTSLFIRLESRKGTHVSGSFRSRVPTDDRAGGPAQWADRHHREDGPHSVGFDGNLAESRFA